MDRLPCHHEVKGHPTPFQALWDKRKPFEVRRDDRNYAEGDTITIHEVRIAVPADGRPMAPIVVGHTGRWVRGTIGYLLKGLYGLPPDLCVFAFHEHARSDAPSGVRVSKVGP